MTTLASGIVHKLKAKHTNPLEYSLPLSNVELPLNPLLGNAITIQFLKKIECIGCGKIIPKSYQQGYCFPCTQTLASCDICIVRPEKCHFHLGTCREPDWGLAHCMIPHVVYLANTSGLKVGITRETQIPTRWIDQGASEALPIARVRSRQIAGLLEVSLTQYFADKTAWRKMLSGENDAIDLKREWQTQMLDKFVMISKTIGEEHITWLDLDNEPIRRFNYPVLKYLPKIKSLTLEESKPISGTLLGVKGQYLIFDVGVLNIRNLIGYSVQVNF